MPKYEVRLMKTLWTAVTVEANGVDEALNKAFDSDAIPGSICAQCVGWGRAWTVDEGEWDTPPEDIEPEPVKLIE